MKSPAPVWEAARAGQDEGVVPFSILDLSPITEGSDAAQAIRIYCEAFKSSALSKT